jgi:hypothetical protein
VNRQETRQLLIRALHEAHAEGAENFIERSGIDRDALAQHCEWVYEIMREHFQEATGTTDEEAAVAALQSSIQLGYKLHQLLAEEKPQAAAWTRKEQR